MYLYDSLFEKPTSDILDTQLALLYRKEVGNLRVTIAPIQQQRGGADCGVFAISVSMALAMGEDPTLLRWRQDKMRLHLSEIFKSEIITPFPITTDERLKSNLKTNLKSQFEIQLYCFCRLPSYASRRWWNVPSVNYGSIMIALEFQIQSNSK